MKEVEEKEEMEARKAQEDAMPTGLWWNSITPDKGQDTAMAFCRFTSNVQIHTHSPLLKFPTSPPAHRKQISRRDRTAVSNSITRTGGQCKLVLIIHPEKPAAEFHVIFCTAARTVTLLQLPTTPKTKQAVPALC